MRIDQRHHDVRPADRTETVIVYALSFIFLGGLVAELLSNYEPRKLAAVLFVLWWMPLVLWHEWGHALMARLLGWRVGHTVIGFGKVVYRGQLLGAPLEIRRFPIEGFVQIAPLSTTGARWKHALIYFAGPGIELLLFIVIVLALGGADFFVIEEDYFKLALQSLAYAALVGAVMNLIPLGIVTHEGETPNDGMGIIRSLLSSDKDYQQWVDQTRLAKQHHPID